MSGARPECVVGVVMSVHCWGRMNSIYGLGMDGFIGGEVEGGRRYFDGDGGFHSGSGGLIISKVPFLGMRHCIQARRSEKERDRMGKGMLHRLFRCW